MNAVELNALSKVYDLFVGTGFKRSKREIAAVQSVDLLVPAGQSLALIGPNGAGKSSIIKMLTGILRPSSGDASVLGLRPWKDRVKLSYKIGSVFGQRSQLWYHLAPRDSFELLARIYDLPKNDFKNRLNELADRLSLSGFIDQPVRKLSLGQRIRAEIAASLLHRPKLLFLDEPSIGLDVVARQELRQLLRDWKKQEGLTVFLTSHDAGDIEAVSERVVVINHGKIVLDDSVANVRKDYLSERIVSVVFHDDVAQLQVDGLKVLENTGKKHRYELDGKNLSVPDLVGKVLAHGNVADISIDDPPLEDVIAHIYSQAPNASL